jgi:hypothetical protein
MFCTPLFGASSRSITLNSRSQSVEIQASEEGKLADHIKLFVWVPGCNIATFEIVISEFADVQEPFSCSPLSTVTLFGQIGRANQLPKKPSEVRIDYLAPWACRFFGFADCLAHKSPWALSCRTQMVLSRLTFLTSL